MIMTDVDVACRLAFAADLLGRLACGEITIEDCGAHSELILGVLGSEITMGLIVDSLKACQAKETDDLIRAATNSPQAMRTRLAVEAHNGN